jgi:hypothetical protein
MIDPFTLPLLTSRNLTREGMTSRQKERHLDSGDLVRLRRGVYVEGAEWSQLRPEGKRVVRARGWAEASDSAPVFSHATAAAIHGLPVFRARDERTHVVVPLPRHHLADDISRHRGSVDSGVTEIGGLRVTTLPRTIADLGRFDTAEAAITATDAALRTVSKQHDAASIAEFRERALDFLPRRAPGSAASSRTIHFADPRADRPGESVSRLYLHYLGFPAPRLQIEVPGQNGSRYFVDFGFDELRTFGEFDGESKYRDPEFLAGRTPEEALRDEKAREDWIRGTTGWAMVRWTMRDLASARVLLRRLMSFNVRPPFGRTSA